MSGSLQIKNGKYYAVISYKNEQGKRKQKWVNTNLEAKGNKRKAEDFLNKLLANDADFSEGKSDVLFCDYMKSWVERQKGKVEVSTQQGYLNVLNKHVYPYFSTKKIKLRELSAKDISKYYTHKMNEGLSPSTIKKHHANIRKCLQCAVVEELIPINYADRVELPKIEQYNASFFDSEQIKVVLEKAKGTEIEHIIILCVYYGLRRSEVLGLKWNAINFNDNTIRIYNTVTYMYTMCEKERTKNTSSNRTLPLIPIVREYLLSLKKKQEENRKLFGNCYQESDYICVQTDGSRITPHSASHRFSNFLKNNGFPHIRLHDLRHSCASLLIAQGVDIKIIQEWLGHSSIATTGNIYGHLQFKQKISTGIVLENLLA
mgnify:CR=1 FL=1